MGYSSKTKEKAFEYFFHDNPVEQIPTLLEKDGYGKPSRVSMWKWHKKHHWAERKEQLLEKTRGKLGEKLTDVKVRQLGIIKEVQAKYEEALRQGGINLKTIDAIKAMQHELLLLGEATERVESRDILDVDRVKEIYDRIKKENKQ